jgi:Tat protein secretion system quality control protein TatD with DNase activity
MKPEFYDTHAHLDDPDFAANRAQAIARCRVIRIVALVHIAKAKGSEPKLIF